MAKYFARFIKACSAEDLRFKIHMPKKNPGLIIRVGIITKKFIKNHLNDEASYKKLDNIYHHFLVSYS